MKIYTKEKLIEELKNIREMGWVPNSRPGNAGGVGNTLEDLLGIKENNLPIPNAAEWELKCQKKETSSLITLFHMEPSPRTFKFVPSILLPKYGWDHKTIRNEFSFRQTINAVSRSDRGFGVIVDYDEKKVLISFDAKSVSSKHNQWLESVYKRTGWSELSPQPYWGFDDLYHKAGTKLLNCFYVQALAKIENGKEYFLYKYMYILQSLAMSSFINAIEKGYILIDFDARSGHNHGTKFRLRQDKRPEVYGKITEF